MNLDDLALKYGVERRIFTYRKKNMKSCSILISSWCGHKATELCIESILKRTKYEPYKIIVCDSSPKDSMERKYLRNHKDKGNIELLENEGRLSHGKALNNLLSYCKTELACILDSDNEILKSDWLEFLATKIQSSQDLGVGVLVRGENPPDQSYFRPPWFPPSCLFLNMVLYRQFRHKDDWSAFKIPMSEFKYRDRFQGDKSWLHQWFSSILLNRDRVEYDTGMKFAERVVFDNPNELKMHCLSLDVLEKYIHHYAGMSAYNTRLDGAYMASKMSLLKTRLHQLRGEI